MFILNVLEKIHDRQPEKFIWSVKTGIDYFRFQKRFG
jgi:hypothetical protein